MVVENLQTLLVEYDCECSTIVVGDEVIDR
jgi:hypothetical protein